jgi:hypothetical protein
MRSAGELAAGCFILAEKPRDLWVVVVEDVAQQEHCSLGEEKRFQQHEKRQVSDSALPATSVSSAG